MKKFISILLCAVMLSVYFTVFSVPVFADPKRYDVSSWDDLKTAMNAGGEINIYLKNDIIFPDTISVDSSCKITFFNDSDKDKVVFDVGSPDVMGFQLYANNVELYFNNNVIIDGKNMGWKYRDDGQGIWVRGYQCVVSGCEFKYLGTIYTKPNDSGYFDGGAIYITGEACTIENCSFYNCNALGCGGAICVWNDYCTINNCYFMDCESEKRYGESIYVCDWSSEAKIFNCTFDWSNSRGRNHSAFVYGDVDTEVIACTPNVNESSNYIDCIFTSREDYYRKNEPSKILHPAYPEEGYYIIHSAVNPYYCLNIGTEDNEDDLRLSSVDKANANIFELKKDENGDAYKITAVQSEKVLAVLSPVSAEGTNICQNPDNGTNNQRWIFEDDPVDGYYIHAVEGGWMDAAGMIADENVNVYSWSYTGAKNQMWILEKTDYVPSTASTLSNGNTWIIAGIGVVAIGALAVVIAKKKKKVTE